jgi:hypothetical protein
VRVCREEEKVVFAVGKSRRARSLWIVFLFCCNDGLELPAREERKGKKEFLR